MLPPTSMHLRTRCRVLRVARRSSWRRSFILKSFWHSFSHYQHLVIHPSYYDACDVSCDVIYYVIAVRARRMVRILVFILPYLGNRSKSDPCSHKLFCLESHILSFPKVLQIPPESPCICYITFLNMFRAVPCSSSGGQIVLLQRSQPAYCTAVYREWQYQRL